MEFRSIYTPILKGSEGDVKALGRMPRAFVNRVRPLVELLSPDEDQSIDDSYVAFAQYLRKHCPFHTVSVDLHSIAPHQLTKDGDPAFEALCDYMRGVGIQFIPVFGFDHEPELWSRVATIAIREQRGITFRLRVDDLEGGDDTVEAILDRLDRSNFSSKSVSLMLDLGSIGDLELAELSKLRDRTQDFVDSAASAREFRLISVVGSSMPKDVSDVPRDGMEALERVELPLWLDSVANLRTVPISFGDYGVVHPNFSMKNPAPNANAKIRYTRGQHHHIFRGDSLKRQGFQQFHEIAGRVVNSPVYLSAGYSFGDDYTWRCSKREVGTGNLGTWVEVDMNHHMVYAADHLPQMVAKLASGASVPEVLAAA